MVTLYTIHADGNPVYLPQDMWDKDYEDEQITPTSANLVMEDNKSGSLVFSILPQNLEYDDIDLIKTTIKVTEYVYDDDGSLDSEKILWKGRAISVEDDMGGIRTFTCEGALAFLNDIICYPTTNAIVSDVVTADDGYSTTKAMKNEALRQALQDYLDDGGSSFNGGDEGIIFKRSPAVTQEFADCIYTVGKGYNGMASFGRTFRVGRVTIGNNRGVVGFIDATEADDGAYSSEDYPDGAWMFKGELSTPTAAFASALDQILNITVDLNGGHLRVRHEEVNGKERMYLDYLGDFTDADASAEYGVNIIEFDGKIELNSPVTDIIARGAVKSTWNGNEVADDAVDTSVFQIGNTVYFSGNYHYVASTSDAGYKCTPGNARITNINFGAKHPIHLVHTGDDSTVYGWVNQSDIYRGSTNSGFEFVGRHYDSYPYTEYVGIPNNGYDGGLHVVNESLMSRYGRIQRIVDFPDISDPTELKAAAEEWLEAHSSFLKQTYEISLVDLGHVYGSGETPIHLLDRVHVSMPNHSIDEYMPVTKIELDLLNPANTTISFSRETNRSTIRRARSRAAAAVTDPSVQLNQPNDSISQSLARNIQYISETNAHATINTSVTQNMKVTLPGGETTTVDVKEENGTTNTLIFVNGLLSGNGKRGSAPKYDIFSYNWKYIVGRGIRKPVCDQYWLFAVEGLIRDAIFSSDPDNEFTDSSHTTERHYYVPTYNNPSCQRVYAIPHGLTQAPNDVAELVLDNQYGSPGYGLYYRISDDGTRKYWSNMCIYYLPSNYSGPLYIFCAIPAPRVDPFNSITDANNPFMTQMVCKFNRLADSGDRTISTEFKNMFNDIIAPEMINDLKLQYRKSMPTYTTIDTGTFRVLGSDYKRPPCTAILLTPYQSMKLSKDVYNRVRVTFEAGLQCNYNPEVALVRESSDYTYINGSPRPNRIKLYNGRDAIPRNTANISGVSNSVQFLVSDGAPPNMSDKSDIKFGDDIKTNITTPKYYIFTSEEDRDACMEDYISSGLSQYSIEDRYRSKIISVNNGYASGSNPEYSQMQVAYRYNGTLTKFYTAGSAYGDP